MKRYIPCGCKKCDFSEKAPTRTCEFGMCNSYEESYIKSEVGDLEIGYASLEDFNKAYKTNWQE